MRRLKIKEWVLYNGEEFKILAIYPCYKNSVIMVEAIKRGSDVRVVDDYKRFCKMENTCEYQQQGFQL